MSTSRAKNFLAPLLVVLCALGVLSCASTVLAGGFGPAQGPSGSSSSASSLSAVLAVGNTTGGTDLLVSTGDEVRFDSASGVQVRTGSGTPESAVAAVVGSLFMRTDGGSSTTLYVKESGSGNTGWVAVGGGGGSLATTLAAGNTTGGTDIVLTAGDVLVGGSSTGTLSLAAAATLSADTSVTITPFLEVGSGTSAAATGDFSAGNGTNELFWDASTFTLEIRGTGDEVAQFLGSAHDGSSWGQAGFVKIESDTAPSAGSTPGRVSFWTTSSGSTTATQRWRINGSGHFLSASDDTYDIGASGTGRPRDGYIARALAIGSRTGTMATGNLLVGDLNFFNYTDWTNQLMVNNGFELHSNGGFVLDAGGPSGVITFQTVNASRWRMNNSGHFLAGADNTYDIGASGATRPRNVYVAGFTATERNVASKTTSPYTVSANESWTVYDNQGAGTTDIVFTLPAVNTGLTYTIKQVASGTMSFDPPSGSAIVWSGGQAADGEALETNGIGSSITLTCSGTLWLVTNEVGTIVEESP